MHVRGPCVAMNSEPVQSPEPLSERPHAALLAHEVLEIEVGSHLEHLCRCHDQMPLSLRSVSVG